MTKSFSMRLFLRKVVTDILTDHRPKKSKERKSHQEHITMGEIDGKCSLRHSVSYAGLSAVSNHTLVASISKHP